MKISSVNTYNNIVPRQNNVRYSKSNMSFGHHPDFDNIIKNFSLCASSYFRRGFVAAEPSHSFVDVLNVFKKVFGTEGIKKLLIVGIAHSEEPFSYLSTIKPLKKDTSIEEFLDLHIIDLQSKPDKKALFEDSYTIDNCFPDYAKDSFIYDPDNSKWSFHKYRVNDELFNYLNNVYNDSSKSKWETRVQEGITTYPKESFDVISINNVLYYIDGIEVSPTIENLYKALKPNGYIITEQDRFIRHSNVSDKLERIAEGIFRKKAKSPNLKNCSTHNYNIMVK